MSVPTENERRHEPVRLSKPVPTVRTPGNGGHGWTMIACCIPHARHRRCPGRPGVASIGFLFVAVMCTAMMALMMRGMHDDR